MFRIAHFRGGGVSAAGVGERGGALVLLAEMIREFFGELHFLDFVAAQRFAHRPLAMA